MTSAPRPVGVLGARGAVGREVVAALLALGGEVRCAGRPRPGPDPATDPDARAVESVDVDDAAALGSFAAGCSVVVNTVGPARRIGARVAQAVLRAGADLVDAGSDETVRRGLDDSARRAGRVVLVGAGALPGLSGLLPRWSTCGFDRVSEIEVRAGALDRFTAVAAADYLDGVLAEDVAPLAAWRDGGARARTLVRTSEELADGRAVTLLPYLDTEARAVSAALGADTATWYSAIDGEHLARALDRARALPHDEAIAALCRSAALDVAGREPVTRIAVTAIGTREGCPRRTTTVLRTGGVARLTARVAAAAAAAVVAGEVAAGAHRAALVLDPLAAVERLVRCGVPAPTVREGGPDPTTRVADPPSTIEEGAL